MTYKKIVAAMVEQDARQWMEKVLSENGYDEAYVFVDDVQLENDKEKDTIYWTVKVDIRFKMDIINYHFEIGGTADDLCGICHSVIWTADKKQILWMSVKESRKQLGIESFKIA